MESLQANRIFGAYLIKRKLGAGGMASVFQAINQATGQEVALKILHEHYADDPLIRKRLEHEARIVMRLSHPQIVPVLDYGEAEKRPYLVMPYMSGGSLADYFAKPRSVKHETTLKLLTLLANGLDYAHTQEVVHRDFKLENILIGANNLPAISDFGIAQSANTTRITMTGQILGTPQYLAPENLDTNGVLNYRADFYALAVMAYLMLTGYFPFTGKDPLNLAIKHRTETAPTPSLANPHLPKTVDSVLLRGLAKNPDDRYPSAKAFVEALDDAFAHAALVTTQIFVNALNPAPTKPDFSPIITPNLTNPATIALSPETIPAVIPAAELAAPAKSKRSKRPLAFLLLFFLCTGISLAYLAMNSGMDFGITADSTSSPELTSETIENLAVENTEALLFTEESANPNTSQAETAANENEATSSPSATRTLRPTNTPRDTATNRPTATNTSRPLPTSTNTPRPLPTNTPQPQPTSVPPTNAPAPTNPPDTGGGGILNPILEPVDTLVPCIPIPLVRTCD